MPPRASRRQWRSTAPSARSASSVVAPAIPTSNSGREGARSGGLPARSSGVGRREFGDADRRQGRIPPPGSWRTRRGRAPGANRSPPLVALVRSEELSGCGESLTGGKSDWKGARSGGSHCPRSLSTWGDVSSASPPLPGAGPSPRAINGTPRAGLLAAARPAPYGSGDRPQRADQRGTPGRKERRLAARRPPLVRGDATCFQAMPGIGVR
jgi:hypothetical protein